MIDFHTHILPGIDDGSSNAQTSLSMIEKEKIDGVDRIVFTPHFYAWRQEPETFLKNRENSFLSIREHIDIPCLLGAEVAYFYGISHSEATPYLTMGDSNFILVEMPFQRWSEIEVNEVENLLYAGYVPILAHIERFLPYKNMPGLKRLKRAGCLMQMNAECLLEKNTKKIAVKLLKSGFIDCLGSDCHNLENRAPNLKAGWDELKNLCGERVYCEMIYKAEDLSSRLFEN